MLKFGIYTSFYNVEKYVNRIFESIEAINYENFEWHITDDFSTDNTKSLMIERYKRSPIKDRIILMHQNSKQEMYWEPNLFFDRSFDWIVLVDSDDLVNPECLSVYNKILKDASDVVIVSSDFHKKNIEDDSLHSISYIINQDIMSNKVHSYHPKCDYLNNISYSCFGHLRAFKNNIIEKFEISNNLAGAEDSYRIFWMNSYGKYLHIPRPLYTWYLRKDSISHSPNVSSSYNDNFEVSFNKLLSSDQGVDNRFNEIYLETCSMCSYDFEGSKNKKISLWTRTLPKSHKELLTQLYFDLDLSFNNLDSDVHIFTLNYFSSESLEKILKLLTGKKLVFYYQNQKFHLDNDEKDKELQSQLKYYGDPIGKYFGYSWWTYIRHFIIKTDER